MSSPFPVDQILHEAREDDFYVGHPNLVSTLRWIPAPDGRSELLTHETAPGEHDEIALAEEVQEAFLPELKMICQIRVHGNWVRPDGHYNPARPTTWQVGRNPVTNLVTGVGSITVGPVPPTVSPTLHGEWAVYTRNISEVMRKVLPCVSKTGFPIEESGQTLYKLSHPWFEDRGLIDPVMSNQHPPESKDDDDSTDHGSDSGEGRPGFDFSKINNTEELELNREPHFRTTNVPLVHPENRPTLLDAARHFSFNPLCAFMRGEAETPLRPDEYSSVLPGAIAQVTFTLSHKLIKRSKPVSHFTATIGEVQILRRPVKTDMSPAKSS
ncbi:hypothetical protein RhiJN_18767 [Ceratobasidium sp. AG-Ba]|nr:hypothetical protein RhiJN_18767 [Ceratobasidium sp. AG-Ba]